MTQITTSAISLSLAVIGSGAMQLNNKANASIQQRTHKLSCFKNTTHNPPPSVHEGSLANDTPGAGLATHGRHDPGTTQRSITSGKFCAEHPFLRVHFFPF